jgi:hypothetical protein
MLERRRRESAKCIISIEDGMQCISIANNAVLYLHQHTLQHAPAHTIKHTIVTCLRQAVRAPSSVESHDTPEDADRMFCVHGEQQPCSVVHRERCRM